MERAMRLKGVGDLRRAFLLLKEVLKLEPNHPDARREADEIDAALREVETVKTEALELEKTGNLEDALRKVEDLLGRYPGSDDIKRQRDVIKRAYDSRIISQHMRRADDALAAGNLQAALVALDGALRLDPRREDILARRRDLEEKTRAADQARTDAKAAFEGKRYAEAFRRATEVLRGNPADADMTRILDRCRGFLESSEDFVRRGREQLEAGRVLEARQELEAAAQLRPDDEEVRTLLAEAEGRLASFRDLLSGARSALGDGRFDEARAKVGEVLRNIPGDPEALGLMATIARQEAESRKSSEVQRAVEEGDALERKGDLEGALQAYRAALEADPDSGRAAQARDRVETRIREFSSIRSLADEHLRDGRFEEALHSLEKLRSLVPDDRTLAAEVEEAREKVRHIQDALRRAEKAAQDKNHRVAAGAAKEVLDLSPNHVRAQSLKRDAERALNAIDRHIKEAERLVSSQIFEEAVEQLKKARQKGATEEMVAALEKTAVSGITASLKTEATRFYSAKDYSAALDAYERILDFTGAEDGDARKGKQEAERRLRSLTSEPLTMRAVVAGAAASLLLLFQVGAVPLRPPPSLKRPEKPPPEVFKPAPTIEHVAILPLEQAGNLEAALELWKKQPEEFPRERKDAATVLGAILAARKAVVAEDPVAAIRELQRTVDPVLVREENAEYREARTLQARNALTALTDRALDLLAKAQKEDPEKAFDLTQAFTAADLVGENLKFLKADRLNTQATMGAKSVDAERAFTLALRIARKAGTRDGWRNLEAEIQSAADPLVDRGAADAEAGRKFAEEFVARKRVEYQKSWRDDLVGRFRAGLEGEAFLAGVAEAGEFLEEFGLLGQAEEQDRLLRELQGK
jgi:tetratricopeptide (TPR) repeat protein